MEPKNINTAITSILCAIIAGFVVYHLTEGLWVPSELRVGKKNANDNYLIINSNIDQELKQSKIELEKEKRQKLEAEKRQTELEVQLAVEKKQQSIIKLEHEKEELKNKLKEEIEKKKKEVKTVIEIENDDETISEIESNKISNSDFDHETLPSINGRARLEWFIGGSEYIAFIESTGRRGFIDVIQIMPNGFELPTVRQDLDMVRYGNDLIWEASNPRYLSNGLPALYSPDNFLLKKNRYGGWVIVENCDENNVCADVSTESID